MGETINRIEREFIITNLMNKKTEIHVHLPRAQISTFINLVEKDNLELITMSDAVLDVPAGEEITIFFLYFGHVMTFSAIVQKVTGNKLTIDIPKDIYKNLLRKHERLTAFGDIKVSFLFKGSKLELDLPKADEIHFGKDGKNKDAPVMEKGKIVQLINEFKENIRKHVSEESIRMYRSNKPETLEEKLITSIGKAWYVPSFDQGLMESDFYPEGRLVTIKSFRTWFKENPEEGNWEECYKEILEKKKKQGIYSEFLCPILYREYIAGFIRLANTGEKKVPLNRKLLDYVIQFSMVLSTALDVNDYFKLGSSPGQARYNPTIIDISASGILFSSDSQELDEFLVLYGDLKLDLKTLERKISVPARVMRKYKSGSLYFFGMQFLNIQREDFRYLFEYLYGRPFTLKEQDRWEGGTAPPKVQLT